MLGYYSLNFVQGFSLIDSCSCYNINVQYGATCWIFHILGWLCCQNLISDRGSQDTWRIHAGSSPKGRHLHGNTTGEGDTTCEGIVMVHRPRDYSQELPFRLLEYFLYYVQYASWIWFQIKVMSNGCFMHVPEKGAPADSEHDICKFCYTTEHGRIYGARNSLKGE